MEGRRILFIYLGFYVAFKHCTGHITTGSWKGRGNQYIQFISVLYCKLPTNGKQLPAFPLEAMTGTEPRPQRWEVSVTILPPWPLEGQRKPVQLVWSMVLTVNPLTLPTTNFPTCGWAGMQTPIPQVGGRLLSLCPCSQNISL